MLLYQFINLFPYLGGVYLAFVPAFVMEKFSKMLLVFILKAVAILPSTAICSWNLFCCNHSHVFT